MMNLFVFVITESLLLAEKSLVSGESNDPGDYAYYESSNYSDSSYSYSYYSSENLTDLKIADAVNCTQQCGSKEFSCTTISESWYFTICCISKENRCDGSPDCLFKEDEEDCGNLDVTTEASPSTKDNRVNFLDDLTFQISNSSSRVSNNYLYLSLLLAFLDLE
ncbi:Oidioi.mRNA.OKI2018_I69.PAR.g8799.t1.cds [Oikopleura dioica]|uniref:Oidioi.mRNA.OKI2018_I69.PAR.g8799.t1.cds n=1 Tax=Oikopleura dioica TaxID=34765 RepID=A0ABN7RHM0_OIKDI|nr:Oidioi.mRNA.OKI2018_I69.PAR.g8799.t1.cds [Oikopleura dioica]